MTVYVHDPDFTLHLGDVRQVLAELPAESVDCCVTSPPYWRLRDYGHDGQIGLEQTPDEYVAELVDVFSEVRRVLKPQGTLWLNLGDSYATRGGGEPGDRVASDGYVRRNRDERGRVLAVGALKPKDLVGIPWRVAFALQEDGWYLRSDTIEEVELYCPCGCGHVIEERVVRRSQDREIIWHKPNPMPEAVKDRPTKAHEYVFLLSKGPRYFYDADAIAEPATWFGPNGRPKEGPHAGQMGARADLEIAAWDRLAEEAAL